MEISHLDITSVRPYEKNAKLHDAKQIANVAKSIKKYGWQQPIVVDADGCIIIGHCRLEAAKKLGMDKVPCVCADDLTPEQVRELRLLDNKLNESAWDFDLLAAELPDLDFAGFDIDWGLLDDEEEETALEDTGVPGSMRENFGVPPFSVLDATQADWQKRKAEWLALGIRSEESREDVKTYDLSKKWSEKFAVTENHVSVFDPVLCELMYNWFCPAGGTVFDPFAGGSVRGIVSEMTGRAYTGIDLRQEQVDANNGNAAEIGVAPTWICDDSSNMDNHVDDEAFDMVFSCPPYADLEVYSDNPQDLSTMEYNEFRAVYGEIISKAARKLKPNRFLVLVVGEVRSKSGEYYNFVGDTITCGLDAGLKYYNEIILATAIGSLPMRAAKPMNTSRKIGKRHQNVLVFYKGDPKAIKEDFGTVEFPDISTDNLDEAV